MSKIIYVANLPNKMTETQIKTLFGQYGDIHSIKLINEEDSAKVLAYGFIEMDDEPAEEAIFALNGKNYEGQELQVNQARGRNNDR